jgi:hypothetical protein
MHFPYSITANELAQANYCSLQLSKSTRHSGIVKKTALCIATCKERRRRRTYSHPQLRNKTYIVWIFNTWTNIVVDYKGSQCSEQNSLQCIYHINALSGDLQDSGQDQMVLDDNYSSNVK